MEATHVHVPSGAPCRLSPPVTTENQQEVCANYGGKVFGSSARGAVGLPDGSVASLGERVALFEGGPVVVSIGDGSSFEPVAAPVKKVAKAKKAAKKR